MLYPEPVRPARVILLVALALAAALLAFLPRRARAAPPGAEPGLLAARGEASLEGPNRLHLTFGTPVGSEALRAHVETTADVPLAVYRSWRDVSILEGRLPAGRRLFLRILPGLEDEDGRPVPPVALSVEMPSYEPAVRWLDGASIDARRRGRAGGLVERAGPAVPRLATVNVPGGAVELQPVGETPWRLEPIGPAVVRPLASPAPDEPYVHAVPLPGPGAWVATARSLDGAREDRCVLQSTDLAITVKIGRARSLVAVTRLGTAQPVGGAKVALHAEDGTRLWSGEADAQGLAWAPGAAALEGAPWWALARSGDDAAWVEVEGERLAPWRLPVERASPWAEEPLPVWVGTDRPIYRPGDEVCVKGFAGGALLERGARPASIQVALVDPLDQVLERRSVTVSALGGFDARFDLPARGRTGAHRVKAWLEGGRVAAERSVVVSPARPAPFEAAITLAAPRALAGERVRATLSARTYAGDALEGAAYRWRATLRGTQASGRGALDARGEAEIEVATGPGGGTLEVEATVEDAAGRPVAASASLPVLEAEVRLSLSAEATFVHAGRPLEVSLEAIDARGRALLAEESPEVRIALVRSVWSTVERRTAGGGLAYVGERRETVVATRTARPGTLRLEMPSEPGDYVVRASALDAGGRTSRATLSIWAAGPGAAAFQRREDRMLEIVPDRARYAEGETARLLVQHAERGPRAGPARALLTLEREGVLEARWVDLDGEAPVVAARIPEGSAPCVHASILLLRGRGLAALSLDGEDLGAPRVQWGAVTLAVDATPMRLPVAVRVAPVGRPEIRAGAAFASLLVGASGAAPRAVTSAMEGAAKKDENAPDLSVEPGTEVAIEVATAPGAEIALAVVDEAVLALAAEDEDATDPHALFFAPRPLRVQTSDPRPGVIAAAPSEVRGKKGRAGGGGGKGGGRPGDEGRARRDFRATALFEPRLVADATGRAAVRLRLPDSLTRWRVLAVAAAPGGRHGAGRARVEARKPLMITDALPRFARAGDSLVGRAVLVDGTGSGRAIEVALHGTDGPAAATLPALEAPSRRPAVLDLPLTVTATGARTVRIAARTAPSSAPGFADALERTLPVLAAGSPETIVRRGRAPFVEEIDPRTGLASLERATLTIGTSPLAPLAEELSALLDYPHGCVEQTSSKTIPLAVCADLGVPETQERLAAGVARLLSMQIPSGAFAYWPGEEEPHPAGTIYATHALLLADGAGARVPAAPLERALAAVEERLRDPRAQGRSYALYVASLGAAREARAAGATETAAVVRLLPYLESLRADPFTALAALALGRRERAREILEREAARRGAGAAALAWARLRAAEAAARVWRGVRAAPHVPDAGERFLLEALEDGRAREVDWFASRTRDDAVRALARALAGLEPGETPASLLERSRLTYERAFSLVAVRALLEREAFLRGAGGGARELLPRAARVRVTQAGRVLHDGPLPGALRLDVSQGPALVAADGMLDWTLAARGPRAEADAPPESRGLTVRRVYERVAAPDVAGVSGARRFVPLGAERGGRLHRGDVVRVRVVVVSPRERGYVCLEDPLPAGLEPIEVGLRTTEASLGAAVAADPGDFGHVEAREDRVFASAFWIREGASELRYLARAATEGDFAAPAPLAEAMYDPEVHGRGEAQRVTVEGR